MNESQGRMVDKIISSVCKAKCARCHFVNNDSNLSISFDFQNSIELTPMMEHTAPTMSEMVKILSNPMP